MSDREALLAAIRANPDDDTTRLVFADWLDENEPDAKPRAKRKKAAPTSPSSWAALIRAECEFERLKNDSSAASALFNHFSQYDEQTLNDVRWARVLPDMVRRVELHNLIPALRKASAKVRAAGKPNATPGASWDNSTHRGFPSQVFVYESGKWIQRLPELMQHCPRVWIEFNSYHPLPGVDELVAAGLPRWCRSLSIHAVADHANLIVAMSRSPDTTGVRELQCSRSSESHITPILTAVAESPHWSGLRELEFNSCFHAPAELVGRFFGAPHLRGLTRLSISHGERMPEVVASLNKLPELRALALTNSALDDDAAEQLANMPGLASLRSLHLTFNQITGRGASALLTSPHLKNLAVLDLEGNPIHGLDRAALKEAPVGELRLLGLQSCRLTATDITAITSSPRVSDLVFFAACYNPFPESTIAKLVKGFGDRAPAVLYLMGNNIATVGAQALASWPAAAQIDMLHLSGNNLTVPGARAIANCPHLQQLNHICAGVKHQSASAILKKCFGKRADV